MSATQPIGPAVVRLPATKPSSGLRFALTSGHLNPDQIRDLSWQLESLDVDL
jgi:hypothetical protein